MPQHCSGKGVWGRGRAFEQNKPQKSCPAAIVTLTELDFATVNTSVL